MGIKFYRDELLQRRVSEIVGTLGFGHVDLQRVICVRSVGSAARRTIARCYALPRIWQTALGNRAYYLVEVISEKFDKLPAEEQDKVLIHEILHIPNAFGGGFRHHADHVTERNVERLHGIYREKVLKKREAIGPDGN